MSKADLWTLEETVQAAAVTAFQTQLEDAHPFIDFHRPEVRPGARGHPLRVAQVGVGGPKRPRWSQRQAEEGPLLGPTRALVCLKTSQTRVSL